MGPQAIIGLTIKSEEQARNALTLLQRLRPLWHLLHSEAADELLASAKAELLAMHGIETDSGKLERQRRELLADIERST